MSRLEIVFKKENSILFSLGGCGDLLQGGLKIKQRAKNAKSVKMWDISSEINV